MQDGELQRSHLIPAGAFKFLRATKSANPNPLVVTSDWIGQSSKQAADYVFCRKCEDIFNDGGERWVLPRLAQPEGFPLYETMMKTEPIYCEDDFSAYRASDIPDFDAAKIIHFGVGIFWKASVHNWGSRRPKIQIDLGDYAEPIQHFLLGLMPFPAKTYLSVCVLPPTVPLLSTLMPIRVKQKDFHRFIFYVPGVEFELSVGKRVPDFVRDRCVASGPLQLVTSSPEFAKTFGKHYVDALNTARISPGFAKHLKMRGRG